MIFARFPLIFKRPLKWLLFRNQNNVRDLALFTGKKRGDTKTNLLANFRNLQHCHYWSLDLSFHHRHDYKSSNDNLFLDSHRDVEVSQLQWQSWKFSTNLPFVRVSGPLQGVCKFLLILTPASGRFARHNQSFPPTQFELKEQLGRFFHILIQTKYCIIIKKPCYIQGFYFD